MASLVFCGVCPLATVFAEPPPSWQITVPYTLSENVIAQSVVCNHTTLVVEAEVLGPLFAVECHLTLGHQSLLHQSITVLGGTLIIEKEAQIFGDIVQIGGVSTVSPKAKISGKFKHRRPRQKLPKEVLALNKTYLTFSRSVPRDIEHLTRAFQEFQWSGMENIFQGPLDSLEIPGVLEFLFNEKEVRFAQKWQYLLNDIPIKFQAVQFISDVESRDFWKRLLSFTGNQPHNSIQNNLGDGGHWFLQLEHHVVFLWFQKNWLLVCQVEQRPKNHESRKEMSSDVVLQQFILTLKTILKSSDLVQHSGDVFIGP